MKWCMRRMQCNCKPRFALALLLAFALDMFGEPPSAFHTVVWYGKLISGFERRAPVGRLAQLLFGAAMLLISVPLALCPALVQQHLAQWTYKAAHRRGWKYTGALVFALIEGASLKPFFALHMLVSAGREVRLSLECNNVVEARQRLQSLVSRDRSQLTPELIAAAAIESLAENLSDSIVAPLFYYVCYGLPGAAVYRLCNTYDSMIGYHGRYEYLGKAAARLDDVLNFVPSRLTALLIIVCSPLYGGDWHHAWHIWRRDGDKTASPNAGQPMAAIAGALGVQLEKQGHYVLGDREKTLTTHDIWRAERMVWYIGNLTFVLAAFCKSLWSYKL